MSKLSKGPALAAIIALAGCTAAFLVLDSASAAGFRGGRASFARAPASRPAFRPAARPRPMSVSHPTFSSFRPVGMARAGGMSGQFRHPNIFGSNLPRPGSLGGGILRLGMFGHNLPRPGSLGGGLPRLGVFGHSLPRAGSLGGGLQRPRLLGVNLPRAGSLGGGFTHPGLLGGSGRVSLTNSFRGESAGGNFHALSTNFRSSDHIGSGGRVNLGAGGARRAGADLGEKRQALEKAKLKLDQAIKDVARGLGATDAARAAQLSATQQLEAAQKSNSSPEAKALQVASARNNLNAANSILSNANAELTKARSAAVDAQKANTAASQDLQQARDTLKDNRRLAPPQNQPASQARSGGVFGSSGGFGGGSVPGNSGGMGGSGGFGGGAAPSGTPLSGGGAQAGGGSPYAGIAAPQPAPDPQPQAQPASLQPQFQAPSAPTAFSGAAPAGPAYLLVAFRQDISATDLAVFLAAYKVLVVEGPSADGVYKLRLGESLPVDQLHLVVDSMKSQTKLVVDAALG